MGETNHYKKSRVRAPGNQQLPYLNLLIYYQFKIKPAD